MDDGPPKKQAQIFHQRKWVALRILLWYSRSPTGWIMSWTKVFAGFTPQSGIPVERLKTVCKVKGEKFKKQKNPDGKGKYIRPLSEGCPSDHIHWGWRYMGSLNLQKDQIGDFFKEQSPFEAFSYYDKNTWGWNYFNTWGWNYSNNKSDEQLYTLHEQLHY